MNRNFNDLKNNRFDLLIIGGGIFGVWAAYDAALRGLTVALVEKDDWGSQTSCSSSKLIHGGLRYLEYGHFSLVKKSLDERKLLFTIAPHRVYPLEFCIPLYKKGRLKRFWLHCGLWLYDTIAKNKQTSTCYTYHSKKKILKKYPFLKEEILTGGFSYLDAGTDDARFTLEIVAGAKRAGAVVVNHAQVMNLIKKEKRIVGAAVKDCESDATINVTATATINTTGPFTDHLTEEENVLNKVASLSKGVHLVMPGLDTKEAFLLIAKEDRRVFFLIPWYGKTLIGTTDTFLNDLPKTLTVTQKEIDYLLNETNRYIKIKWKSSDICGRFAGLRVLKKSTLIDSSVSREWLCTNPVTGLYISIGGKFTTARNEAETMINRVSTYINKPTLPIKTNEKLFPWCPDPDYSTWMKEAMKRGYSLGLDKETAALCTKRYGTTVTSLYDLIQADTTLTKRIDPAFPFCRAEIIHAVTCEMARTITDVLRRRIPLLILTSLNNDIIDFAANALADTLNWSNEKKENEIKRFKKKNALPCL